jgi:hypothetical protein
MALPSTALLDLLTGDEGDDTRAIAGWEALPVPGGVAPYKQRGCSTARARGLALQAIERERERLRQALR